MTDQLQQLDGEDSEAYEARLLSLFDSGVKMPRELAISLIGRKRDIAWWDMFGPLDAGTFAPSGLEPDEMVKIERASIPAPVWDRHRAKFANPERHGLQLRDEPEAIGVFRYPEGEYGLVIGYRNQ